MLENTWFSVISPESAVVLLRKDSSKGQLVNLMKITAPELKELGIIDEIVPKVKGGAHNNHAEQALVLKNIFKNSLVELSTYYTESIIEPRYNKYRVIGEYKLVEFLLS